MNIKYLIKSYIYFIMYDTMYFMIGNSYKFVLIEYFYEVGLGVIKKNEMWLCTRGKDEVKFFCGGRDNFFFSLLFFLIRGSFWVGWYMIEVFFKE